MNRATILVAVAACAALSQGVWAGELAVASVEPSLNALNVPPDTAIVVHFEEPVETDSVTPARFRVFGRWSGPAEGSFSFSDSDRTVTFTPDQPFSAGEQVFVMLARDIQARSGPTMRAGGYHFQFWIVACPAAMVFEQVASLTTNSKDGPSSQPYGGIASDLNNDGWLDVALTNEITADLRVFMNHADGGGTLAPFIEPPEPLNGSASPSEPADFNGDGIVDICVANQAANTISVLLGNGDGTFAPQQQISVGTIPVGIAVLDMDGDGDTDIVNANWRSSNLSLHINNGSGVFGSPIFFEGGGAGERALSATDMNNDGLMDLVIGAYDGLSIVVSLGQGDGTFALASTRNIGVRQWMIVTGDVNGDGMQDVTLVTGAFDGASRGGILLGDGTGSLAAPDFYTLDSWPIATDLGDLDGDGDLDWVTSSFNGGWMIFRNDGSGAMTFDQRIDAPATASCALLADLDNDGDLDMGLVDETADVLILVGNTGAEGCGCTRDPEWGCDGDVDGDGQVNPVDAGLVQAAFGSGDEQALCNYDIDCDEQINPVDSGIVQSLFGTCEEPRDACK